MCGDEFRKNMIVELTENKPSGYFFSEFYYNTKNLRKEKPLQIKALTVQRIVVEVRKYNVIKILSGRFCPVKVQMKENGSEIQKD